MHYREEMEKICAQCHAVLVSDVYADWCPACGGALADRAALPEAEAAVKSPIELDHRGIVLPRRHALGGIITPQ